ncbi:MAG TPA: RuBisCO large subunit C-terminal-like domain-containing protein [Candidatus Xenobia bacterium]|jgi:ribulose-bisphosphate carboxylase large chain
MSFTASRESLPPDDYVFLHYRFETAGPAEAAAVHLCQESSTAQWCRPGHDEDFRPRHGARLVGLQVMGEIDTPSWASPFHPPGPFREVQAVIAQPVVNFGARLPNLLTVALGEGVFHAPGIATIKLVDLELPDAFLASFEGPRFGIEGLRERLGVFDRPLFIGVVKPNVGLPPAAFAALAEAAWRGGLDIAKDDELLSDVAYSPLQDRLRLCLEGLARAGTGGQLFLANITDEVENLLRLQALVQEIGGDRVALMLNAEPVGLSACRMVARHARVPLFSHFDMQAAFTRMPSFGVSSAVWTSLLRLAGFDAIIMPGPGPRMLTSVEEIQACVRACTRPWGNLRASLPVPGGSDWAGTLARMVEVVGHRDFGFIPGRGVFAHPAGPQAGAASLHQAWQAWMRGATLPDHARHHPELAAALAFFGP